MLLPMTLDSLATLHTIIFCGHVDSSTPISGLNICRSTRPWTHQRKQSVRRLQVNRVATRGVAVKKKKKNFLLEGLCLKIFVQVIFLSVIQFPLSLFEFVFWHSHMRM